MAEKTEPEPKPEDDPYRDWLRLPGIYCDTYIVDVWTQGVARLVFGEIMREGPPAFRASVVMPVEDVREFIKSLQASLDRYDAENSPKTK